MDNKLFIDSYAPLKDVEPDIFKTILETGKTLALTEDGAPKVVVLTYDTFTRLIQCIDMAADDGPLRQLVRSARNVGRK